MQQYENLSSVVETRNHSKNGASPKSQMSKGNRIQKAFLICAVFCVSMASAFAQDIITLKNGTDVQALVQEVGDVDVKYKKFDNPNGPNYTMKKADIFMIRYANGSKDVFADNTLPTETTTPASVVRNSDNSQPKVYNGVFGLTDTSRVYVELEVTGNNMDVEYTKGRLYSILQGKEWNRWILVNRKKDASYTLHVKLEKYTKPLYFGQLVDVTAELLDSSENLLWKSSRYTGNTAAITGYDSLGDALRKLVRRALKKELYKGK